MPEPQRTRAFDRAEHKFDLMQDLGSELLLVCSSVSPAALPGLDRIAEDLFELGERAQARQLRVGYEALAWGKHIYDYRDAWEAVRRADHPAIGTIIDSFHVLSRGHDLAALSNIPAEKIFYIHLADAPRLDMGILPWSRHYRCFPGQGRLPLQDFMAALATTNYQGPLSLEIFNDQFRAASAHQVAVDAKRSLLYVDRDLKRPPLKDLPEDLPKDLPKDLYQGIEFIEFAIAEDEVGAFEALLGALGFYLWGRHRSKQLRVWRQGDIKLVVNSEIEGFAHSYHALLGSSVAALAFRVSDLEPALERSSYYRCKLLPTDSLQSFALPALQGIEGNESALVYLLDARADLWNTEFDLLAPPLAPKRAQLQRIDHLAQVTALTHHASWLLFYRSVFGLCAEEKLDILDPSGLIESQVLESEDRAIRIVLNGSQSASTIAGRFLAEGSSGGVQHIAFACEDLLAYLEAAPDLTTLPIPANYYDDLEARFALEPSLLARLKRLNVLYDESEEGFFLQAYSYSFAKRFFFELVERHSYDAFGASNAPIRIAAQQRQV